VGHPPQVEKRGCMTILSGGLHGLTLATVSFQPVPRWKCGYILGAEAGLDPRAWAVEFTAVLLVYPKQVLKHATWLITLDLGHNNLKVSWPLRVRNVVSCNSASDYAVPVDQKCFISSWEYVQITIASESLICC
jgi:hypothetical protein